MTQLITNQEILRAAWTAYILRDHKPSKTDYGACHYTYPGDPTRHCAVGWALTDDQLQMVAKQYAGLDLHDLKSYTDYFDPRTDPELQTLLHDQLPSEADKWLDAKPMRALIYRYLYFTHNLNQPPYAESVEPNSHLNLKSFLDPLRTTLPKPEYPDRVTNAKIFDAAWHEFILHDKPPTMDGSVCEYQTSDGRQCAVGLCLTEEQIPQTHGCGLSTLVSDFPEWFDPTIQTRIQGLLHDCLTDHGDWKHPRDYRAMMYRVVAQACRLTQPAVLDFEHPLTDKLFLRDRP
jgi:hypothetical protein